MSYFIKNNEVDVNFYSNYLYKRLVFLKMSNENINVWRSMRIFFIFRNILVISGLFIYNYLLFIWLTTGKFLSVKGYDSVYQRGIYYYRFMLVFKTDLFLMLDFFLNFFFIFLEKDDIYLSICTETRIMFKVKSYEIFSNMRLSTYLYLYSLDDPFYLDFFFKDNSKLFLSFFKMDFFLKNETKWVS